jgi:hypothetical protein
MPDFKQRPNLQFWLQSCEEAEHCVPPTDEYASRRRHDNKVFPALGIWKFS